MCKPSIQMLFHEHKAACRSFRPPIRTVLAHTCLESRSSPAAYFQDENAFDTSSSSHRFRARVNNTDLALDSLVTKAHAEKHAVCSAIPILLWKRKHSTDFRLARFCNATASSHRRRQTDCSLMANRADRRTHTLASNPRQLQAPTTCRSRARAL